MKRPFEQYPPYSVTDLNGHVHRVGQGAVTAIRIFNEGVHVVRQGASGRLIPWQRVDVVLTRPEEA